MEKQMQPMTRSEQDKMVPIDTSGASVEIELENSKDKEVAVEEENTVVEEQPVEEPSQEEPQKQESPELEEGQESKEASREMEDSEEDDEGPSQQTLNTYKKRQRRKISKMLSRLKEMQSYADEVQKENTNLKEQISKIGKGYVSEFEGRVTSSVEAAKSKLKKAIEDNDTLAQVEAQEELAQAKADNVRLSNLRANQKREEEQYKANQNNGVQQAPVDYPVRDFKAEAWAAKNPWFNDPNQYDKEMSDTAIEMHEELVAEGVDPTSDEYYNEIDSHMRESFPDYFGETKKRVAKSTMKQPAQTVASVARKSKSGRRTVKLTPSQVTIAKKLGVPLEEYAKYVKEGA
jgi:hypothetical protein